MSNFSAGVEPTYGDDDTIFMALAALNEVDVVQTIENALENSNKPQNIYFGVWYQHTHDNQFTCVHPQVRVVNVKYPISLGLGIARAGTASLYGGEKYVYQNDAHMLFQKDWDKILVERFKEIQNDGYDKPIISYFGQAWQRSESGQIVGYYDYDPETSNKVGNPMMYSRKHRSFGFPINVGDDRSRQKWDATEKSYIEHHSVQGGFIFSSASFIHEVGYDPQHMFFGEEHLLAMRAWTRGYRIFAIKEPVQWHKDRWTSVPYDLERTLVENMHRPPSTPEAIIWDRRETESMSRLKKIFSGEYLGFWGAPTKELLEKYMEASNLGNTIRLEESEPYVKDLAEKVIPK